MTATIILKGDYSPKNTNVDSCYTYYVDKNKIYLQDNDYGLNKRWYPLENIARVDDKND